MNRMTVALMLLLPMVAGAYSTGTTLGGTTTAVNAGPGNQTDPHIDGNLVAYTSMLNGGSEIRYFNFATSADLGIPGAPGALDFLSDVSGPTVVFTRVEGAKQSIWSFNTVTSGPAVELAPDPLSIRRSAAIGGNTVAWQDLGFSTSSAVISEILAYDLTTGVSTRLTNDALVDKTASVAPSGAVIVWEKCATAVSPCDIWEATRSSNGWLASQVTNTPESELAPDTNGTTVVYGAIRAASATGPDIYWTPVAGGAESQLALAGQQRNPNISGNVIAFEGLNIADPTPNYDIYLYDLSTTTLYRLTDTPLLDESLNDISVVGNQVRVVWSVSESGDWNVYGYTFTIAGTTICTNSGSGNHSGLGDGTNPGHGGEHSRGHNHGTNNPGGLSQGLTSSAPPECDDGEDDDDHGDDDGEHHDDDDHGDDDGHGHHHGHHGGGHGGHHRASQGRVASVSASGVHSFADSNDPSMGCSSSGGGAMLAGLLALAGVLMLGRGRQTVSVRADRK